MLPGHINPCGCVDVVSDIAIFVLKMDVKLQPTNLMCGCFLCLQASKRRRQWMVYTVFWSAGYLTAERWASCLLWNGRVNLQWQWCVWRPSCVVPRWHAATSQHCHIHGSGVVDVVLYFECSLCVIMAGVWNRAGHYIFALWFLLSVLFSSPILSRRRLDVYHTSTHSVAIVRI